jgi:hypothetical protein
VLKLEKNFPPFTVTCSTDRYCVLFSFNSLEPLDIRDLYVICSNFWEARIKWYNIGLGLNLEVSDLEAIRQTNRDNVDDCFRDTVDREIFTGKIFRSLNFRVV